MSPSSIRPPPKPPRAGPHRSRPRLRNWSWPPTWPTRTAGCTRPSIWWPWRRWWATPRRGSTGIDLHRLWRKSDGYMDEVHPIRERVRADAVILLRRVGGGAAFGMSTESTAQAADAFGVSGRSAYTFAHELGHIMGLVHDRYQECEASFCSRGVSADAYGYVNQRAFDPGAPASARWHTIMAYPGQCYSSGDCSQVQYFSNPTNCYPGDCPMMTATPWGSSSPRATRTRPPSMGRPMRRGCSTRPKTRWRSFGRAGP